MRCCSASGFLPGLATGLAAGGLMFSSAAGVFDGDDQLPEAGQAPAQDGGLQDALEGAARDALQDIDPDAMMEAWIKAGTPGEHHQMLDQIVGTFRADMTMVNGPGAPEEQATGQMVNSWVLDGRYVRSDFKGDFDGMPFTGIGYTGYSNLHGEMQGLWMDSFSTMIEFATGTCDLDSKVMHMKTKSPDPISGELMDVKEQFEIISRDKHTFTRKTFAPGGMEIGSMTIVYTRVD